MTINLADARYRLDRLREPLGTGGTSSLAVKAGYEALEIATDLLEQLESQTSTINEPHQAAGKAPMAENMPHASGIEGYPTIRPDETQRDGVFEVDNTFEAWVAGRMVAAGPDRPIVAAAYRFHAATEID